MLDNASMLGSHLFRTEIDIRIAELQNSLPRISFKECCDDHPHLRLSKPTTLCLKRRWMSRGNYTSWQLGTKCGDLAGKCHLVIAGRKIRPLPWGSFAEINFFVFEDLLELSAKPLLIVFIIKVKY